MDSAARCFPLVGDAFPGFCLLVGPDGLVVAANDRARGLFGDVLSRPCPLRPPRSRDGDEQVSWEWHADGRLHRVVLTPCPVRGDAGYVLCLGLDLTELEEARALATRRENQLTTILDNAMEGVVVAVDGSLVYANPFMERLTGFDAGTLCSAPFVRFIHEEDRDTVLEVHRRRLAGEPAAPGLVFRLVTREGAVRWVRAVSTRIDWEETPAAVSLLSDITMERQAQLALGEFIHHQEARIASRTESLRQANATLEAANARLTREIEEHERTAQQLAAARKKATQASEAKSVFLANMSHEIRTPLNVILGMADMLLRPDEQERLDRTRALEMIREAGAALRGLLGDLLDLSRGEAGQLSLAAVPFCLREVLDGVVGRSAGQAREKGLPLTATLAPDVPDRLVGDAGRLGQVVGNLVGNAMKFTPAGRIDVRVDLPPDQAGRETEPGTVRLRFSVRDTGIGIPVAQQKRIFENFRQADGRDGWELGGAGLGLAICRQLVGLMGGRIQVSSRPGQGSEFSFTARFALPEASGAGVVSPMAAAAAPAPDDTPPLDILLAEDSNLSAEMIQAFLGPRGHRITRASNGREALDALAIGHFDLVLMDIRMPVMDGLTATRAIREGRVPDCDPSLPILALTAHGAERDRERILAAGATGYLAKPVSLDQLLEALARLGAHQKERDAATAASNAASAAGEQEPFDAGRDEALANLGDDTALYGRLSSIFLRDTPGMRKRLHQALAANDLDTVVLLAHALKGNAGVLGALEAARHARALELAARAGREDRLAALAGVLDTAVDRVVTGLAARGVLPAEP